MCVHAWELGVCERKKRVCVASVKNATTCIHQTDTFPYWNSRELRYSHSEIGSTLFWMTVHILIEAIIIFFFLSTSPCKHKHARTHPHPHRHTDTHTHTHTHFISPTFCIVPTRSLSHFLFLVCGTKLKRNLVLCCWWIKLIINLIYLDKLISNSIWLLHQLWQMKMIN